MEIEEMEKIVDKEFKEAEKVVPEQVARVLYIFKQQIKWKLSHLKRLKK